MPRILSYCAACGLALMICAAASAQTEAPEEGWNWVKAAHKSAPKGKLPFVIPVKETGPWRGKRVEQGKLGFPCADGDMRATPKGSSMGIDTNGDMKPDFSISGKAKPYPLKAKIDGKVVPYTMVFESVRSALAVDTWFFYRTGCYRTAKVGKTTISVIDANANGRYDDYGVDMMVVGKRKHAQWLSKVVPVDGKLVQFKVQADGTQFGTQAYSGQTGTLNLTKGFVLPKGKGKLVAAVVKNDDGLSFDGSTAVDVPTGSYTLVWGALASGKKNRCMFRAEIEIEVTAGQVATAKFGGPVKIAAQFSVDDERKLEVLPSGVFLLGISKEHYFNFQPPLRPKIEIRDASTKKIITRGGFSSG